MTMDFSEQRLSYEQGQLDETSLPNDAKALFEGWIKHAIDAKVAEPYAMSLATCGTDGKPAVRIVLLREIKQTTDGFALVFYTNYDSAKGIDLTQNPNAEALFFWQSQERQVRLSGQVSKLDADKSQKYFHKRPIDSQIAAWVSNPQSGQVSNRQVMEDKFEQLKQQHADDDVIAMPSFWGGYQLDVSEVEFWQGRANRMHDRIVYRKKDNGQGYDVHRLLP